MACVPWMLSPAYVGQRVCNGVDMDKGLRLDRMDQGLGVRVRVLDCGWVLAWVS